MNKIKRGRKNEYKLNPKEIKEIEERVDRQVKEIEREVHEKVSALWKEWRKPDGEKRYMQYLVEQKTKHKDDKEKMKQLKEEGDRMADYFTYYHKQK